MTVEKTITRGLLALVFVLTVTALPGFATAQEAVPPTKLEQKKQKDWLRFWDENQGHKLIMEFSAEYRPATLAIVGINIMPMSGAGLQKNHTLIVRDGRIAEIGPSSEVHPPKGANVITATDLYLIPGLVEAHSHTDASLSQFLVYLTRGVTTLREMDGFDWMLTAREKAKSGDLLIPNLYVAGHILSNRAWDFYMTQVDTVEDARKYVKEQAADGYDFIKIHNSMPEPMFSAIFDEAKKAGLDVVGHIPGEIKIAEAIAAGLRTNEHFKGYIFDQTLEVTKQDFVTATANSDLWNAPSFSNYHEHLRGPEATALAEEENSLRLVPRWLRRGWLEQAKLPVDELTKLRQSIYPKSRNIYRELRAVTGKFFAGTDTGTYAFQVPGYALQEEVRIFQSLGLSPYKALKTATVNSAIAMRKTAEIGTIEVGRRADFVILSKNPLASTKNLASIWGVSLGGRWLHRDALKRIEDALESAFSNQTPPPEPTLALINDLVREMLVLHKAGFPYPVYYLADVRAFAEKYGDPKSVERLDLIRKEITEKRVAGQQRLTRTPE